MINAFNMNEENNFKINTNAEETFNTELDINNDLLLIHKLITPDVFNCILKGVMTQ